MGSFQRVIALLLICGAIKPIMPNFTIDTSTDTIPTTRITMSGTSDIQEEPLNKKQRKGSALPLEMETKEIAPGVHMPVMSIGCGGLERHDAHRIAANWLSLGGTGIDTALAYGNQDQIRKAIAESGVSREDLFITTKIPDCNVANVADNIETNLALLGTSYVDLMLIHFPKGGNCVKAWKVLESYYKSNKTRAIGVSNFRPKHLKELTKIGTILPHVNQIKLNILQKDMHTIDYCTKHNITVEAFSPLGRGGRQVVHHPAVQRIAAAHNVTPYQIAAKWILQHGWILTFQSSSKEHQATDAQVFGFTLTPKEMAELDQDRASSDDLE